MEWRHRKADATPQRADRGEQLPLPLVDKRWRSAIPIRLFARYGWADGRISGSDLTPKISRPPVGRLERNVRTNQRKKQMSEFKREPRYLVLKIKDALAYLSSGELDQLNKIGEKIAAGRAAGGKAPFGAVVVEQDWPEFEPTWAAIETRMTANAD